ncbi:hypothetical protein [Microbulbifer sp. PAAF003]|uniref:hypothetical protein n=1 Tax=Microbulbifer sp. PAAF003 TaxID=3243375 RepID=UPI004039BF11
MKEIKERIINAGLGEKGLPVLARMGEDPGKEYIEQLLSDLHSLCQNLKSSSSLSKELSYVLYCIGHYPYIEYSAWIDKGATFRGHLIDPQIFQLEMAVESIFCNEWLEYVN